MQIQPEQTEGRPFEIIYNARSIKGSRSRKTSVSIPDKDKPKGKTKKLRKMTLNPESVHYQQIREIEENYQRNAIKSLKEEKMQDETDPFDYTKFLELGPKKAKNEKGLQLESGVNCGTGNQKDQNNYFNWSWSKQPTGVELVDINE